MRQTWTYDLPAEKLERDGVEARVVDRRQAQPVRVLDRGREALLELLVRGLGADDEVLRVVQEHP